MRKFYILLLCVFLPMMSVAQNWEVGGFLGGSAYEGDVHCRDSPGSSLTDYTKFAYGIHAKYLVNDILAFRMGIIQSNLEANEAILNVDSRKARGFSFETNITEVALMMEWDILGKRRVRDGILHKILTPYLFGGIGAAFTNPDVNFNSLSGINVAKDKESIKKIHLAIPVGLGIKYDITDRFNIGLEGGLRLPMSDYIDGVSFAANPDANDYYAFAGIIGSMKLGSVDMDGDGIKDEDDRCPDVAGSIEMKGCPDLDGDGLSDVDDDCPNIFGAKETNGCPDMDEDGVMDERDECPEVAGEVRFKGCPDSDGDDIQNSKDECPQVAGLKAFKGCPDSDEDGISDLKDLCPDVAGLKSNGGCPDSDGDGIVDKDDPCPEVKGSERTNGCPDSDDDGVADKDDKCPNTKGSMTDGCPVVSASTVTRSSYNSSSAYASKSSEPTFTGTPTEVKYYSSVPYNNPSVDYSESTNHTESSIYKESEKYTESPTSSISDSYTKVLNTAQKHVLFHSGTSKMRSSSYSSLKKIAKMMKENPDMTLNISGYTDDLGDDDENQCLSRMRAKSCFKYLKAHGISEDRLNYEGYGETNPIGDNTTKKGRKINRRVEFSLY